MALAKYFILFSPVKCTFGSVSSGPDSRRFSPGSPCFSGFAHRAVSAPSRGTEARSVLRCRNSGTFRAAFSLPGVSLPRGRGKSSPRGCFFSLSFWSPSSALGTSSALCQPLLGWPRSLCVGCAAPGGPPVPRLRGDPWSILSTGRPRGQGPIIPVLTEARVWKGTGVSGSACPTGPPALLAAPLSCPPRQPPPRRSADVAPSRPLPFRSDLCDIVQMRGAPLWH